MKLLTTPVKLAARKLEPIFASDMEGLSEQTRMLLLKRAAATSPGLAYELSKTVPAELLSQDIYDSARGLFHSSVDNALAVAVSAGHFALARLFAFRIAATSPVQRSSGRPSDSWLFWACLAQKSSATDGQVWRARRWLAAHAGFSSALSDADLLVQEATSASCNGRPWLALMCARELLALPAENIAKATALPGAWPSEISTDLWLSPERISDRSPSALAHLFAKELSLLHDRHDSGWNRPTGGAVFHAKSCSILEHLAYWAKALRASSPDLSARLSSLERALWNNGAFAAPTRHAALFAEKPYGPTDPRARLCEQGSVQSDGTAAGRFEPSSRLPGAPFFEAILSHCCGFPDVSGMDGAAWDAFVAAHPASRQANPNPFSVWAGSSAALLSLSSNGRLIELALSRGFLPEGSEWVLAGPGAMCQAFERGALPPATYFSTPPGKCVVLGPPGLYIHPRPPALGRGKTILSDGDPLRTPTKADRSSVPALAALAALSGWSWQSFASVALACGHVNLAILLGRAASRQPSLAQVLKEAAPLSKNRASEQSTRFLALYEKAALASLPCSAESSPRPSMRL